MEWLASESKREFLALTALLRLPAVPTQPVDSREFLSLEFNFLAGAAR
jgi:hypothetical protein